MIAASRQKPVFRFAPSPNGALHLGHALSALLNQEMSKAHGGDLLLRIEDIDITRCTPALEQAMKDDLDWLGIRFSGPARRQSEHFAEYQSALDRLIAKGLVYPAFMTRGEVKAAVRLAEAQGRKWPRDPDGAPLYPPADRDLEESERDRRLMAASRHVWRLDMQKALKITGGRLTFTEFGQEEVRQVTADPAAWGDVVLWRSDAPSSYHLSVCVDDALQGISHVVRGLDLFHATAVHLVLQKLLDLPTPAYHHHRLILGEDGRKLSKSEGSAGLAELRAQGLSASDIRRLVGLGGG